MEADLTKQQQTAARAPPPVAGRAKDGEKSPQTENANAASGGSTIIVEKEKTKEIVAVGVERIGSSDTGGTSLAALMLGLGLALLAAFLVFISCRLRAARADLRRARPGRRGKPMNTAEGELLINGMYL